LYFHQVLEASVSDPDRKQTRILLVDDFEIVRLMLRNALTELGFTEIEEAEDGRTAMALLKEAYSAGKPFGFVFCDWNMPEMTGIEVLEACRTTPEFATLPIVMVTAEAEQESVVRAIRAGATDYVVKPIAPDVLERKVNKILTKMAGKAA
jgi:two-component system chemotaxis response regulator CheY